MPKNKIRVLIVLAVMLLLSVWTVVRAENQPLERGRDSGSFSQQNHDNYQLSLAQIQELVDTGQCKAAINAFKKLKSDFPEITTPDSNDLDIFIDAEILLCKGKLAKSARRYGNLLDQIPAESSFFKAALDRQFGIATAFLAGAKKPVLGIFKMKGYAEGVRIMEDISYRLALDDPEGMGLKAEIAVAKSYQERKKFDEAFYRWAQIKDRHTNEKLGEEALLAMAECKLGMYKGPDYDDSDLIGRPLNPGSFYDSVRGCYNEFKLKHPQATEEFKIEQKIQDVDEKLAYKQFKIGQYYQETGNNLSANLYFQMVVNRWPETVTAKIAEQMLINNSRGQEKTE